LEKNFNSAILYLHINELKELIRYYVQKEKIHDENGIYPDSFEEWKANSEFTKVNTVWGYSTYGVKYWIFIKYRNVCKTYSLKCYPIYMDKNY